MRDRSKVAEDDRVRPLTRALAAIVIPALITAFTILYLFPDQSGERFAWPVRPAMTAMMLGAAYLGGVYYFTGVLVARRWHTVHLGFLPVTAFAAILGISTLLHWDRFTHDHIAFRLWALLYFTLPVILPIAWFRNRSGSPGGEPASASRLSRPVRGVFAAFGAVLTVVGLLLFVFPQAMIPTWPWTLTPLTARVMSALFTLPGLVGLGIAADGRWRAARLILQAQALSVVLILLAAVRGRAEFDWSRPGSWLFIAGLSLVLLLIAVVSLRYARFRPEAPAVQEQE